MKAKIEMIANTAKENIIRAEKSIKEHKETNVFALSYYEGRLDAFTHILELTEIIKKSQK